jgi:hypothetical protein
MYSFSGNCAASVPISTFMCLCAIYIFLGLVHIFPCSSIGRPILEIFKFSHRYMSVGRNCETEHYNSVLEITVSFLRIHKWKPDPALHLQCDHAIIPAVHMFRMDMLGAGGLGHTSLHDLGLEVGGHHPHHHPHHPHHHPHHQHEQLHPHQPLPPHRPLSPLHSAHTVDSSFSPSSHLPSSTVKIKAGKYQFFFYRPLPLFFDHSFSLLSSLIRCFYVVLLIYSMLYKMLNICDTSTGVANI